MAYDVKVIESFIRQEAVKRHMNPDAKKGFKGLEDAIGKGLLPAAAIGMFLPYLGGGEEKERA